MVKQTQLANTNTGAFLFSNTKSCMKGGSKGYGVTMNSLTKASNAGLGRGYTGAITYTGDNGTYWCYFSQIEDNLTEKEKSDVDIAIEQENEWWK